MGRGACGMKYNEQSILGRAQLPEDVLLHLPMLHVLGTRRMVIENHCGIQEYTSERIRVDTHHGQIICRGRDLMVRAMDREDLWITGRIETVELSGLEEV